MPPLASKSSTELGLPAGWQPLCRVARAHGTGSTLRLRLASPLADWTAWPTALAVQPAQGPVQSFSVARWRPVGADVALVDVRPARSREALQTLCGAPVWIPREVLPAAEPHEVYLFDLLHKTALDQNGHPLGRIDAIADYGAGSLLSVHDAQGHELLLPLSLCPIAEVDESRGAVRLHVPPELLAAF